MIVLPNAETNTDANTMYNDRTLSLRKWFDILSRFCRIILDIVLSKHENGQEEGGQQSNVKE